jgi:hypothetical protein
MACERVLSALRAQLSAVAKCREGDAKASIPTLERLLEDADLPLPKRT